MEVVTGALPSVITKLGELLIGEYDLQKGVKGEIRFLQAELESMKGALEKISSTPADQLDNQDKIWARELRELSYDIEDNVDTFMVRGKGKKQSELQGIKMFVDRSVGLFRKAKIRHGIAAEIRDIKIRVEDVAKRHDRYMISNDVAKPVKIDPRLFTQYTEVRGLVGVDEARDELIKILEGKNEASIQQHGKIVSIVGFGGLGKTTLANVVYEKIRAQFDCCAFVSVSQTPDMKKLFKGLLSDLGKNTNEETMDEERLIRVLREFLQMKRYFVVIDDLWDILVWKIIKCSLPDNEVGYTIIMTTRKSDIAELADIVYKLRPLSLNNSRNFYKHWMSTRASNGIGKLTCLEQLSWLHIDGCTANTIEELGQLTELRRLCIELDELNDKMLECLGKLRKIQVLETMGSPGERRVGGMDSWVAPRHLRYLHTRICWFSALPAWVNPSFLVDLTFLDITVRELHQVDLEILGRMPALHSLSLEVDNRNLGVLHAFVVGAGSFPCLVFCSLWRFLWPVVFQHGAMPRLREIRFVSYYVMRANEVACSGGGLNLGLGNLPSLQIVRAYLFSERASKEEAEKAGAALRHAAEMHPNNPLHDITID
ncbi:unnamed protein product [Urochloa decumbens]|uniref:Uncharacterized protein n=1 Tax=Urochloa decumbens TaxID=240449 RepID=A0ABC9B4C2_9POAL